MAKREKREKKVAPPMAVRELNKYRELAKIYAEDIVAKRAQIEKLQHEIVNLEQHIVDANKKVKELEPVADVAKGPGIQTAAQKLLKLLSRIHREEDRVANMNRKATLKQHGLADEADKLTALLRSLIREDALNDNVSKKMAKRFLQTIRFPTSHGMIDTEHAVKQAATAILARLNRLGPSIWVNLEARPKYIGPLFKIANKQ